MQTIDVTPYLAKNRHGNTKLAIADVNFSKMRAPDLGDFGRSRTVRPDAVCIFRIPREAISAGGIELVTSAQKTRNVGWVLAVGPEVSVVARGMIVSFLPINFQVDEEATGALIVNGTNAETRETEIGWAIESELERIVPPKE